MRDALDQPQAIAKGAFHFLSGTALSRISGLIRDMSTAFFFGTHPAIAAFLVAFRLANLMRRIFGEGALLNGFVPHFEAHRNESPKKAFAFFRDTFFSVLALLTLLILFLELAIYFSTTCFSLKAENFQILQLIMIILPAVAFVCLFSLCSGLLHCQKSFFLTGVSPLAFNIIWIVSIFLLKDKPPEVAAIGLSIGVTIAFFSQWLMTLPKTLSILLSALSFKELLRGTLFSAEVRKMLFSLSFGMIGVTAAQINTAIDTLFARSASLEGPAYLNNAIHIQQLPLALFGIAISSALLPPLSRAFRSENLERYKELLEFSLSAALFMTLPCAVGIFATGGSCINLIFGRGEFGFESTYHTTLCLWGYGLGLVPMVAALLLTPAFYARNDYQTPMRASLYSILCNLILNALFIWVFHLGVESLAVSTSFASLFNMIYLYRKIGVLFSSRLALSALQIAISSMIAGMITLAVGYFYLQEPTIAILRGDEVHFVREFSLQLYQFAVLFFSFAASFILASLGCKNGMIYRFFGEKRINDKNDLTI